MSRARERRRVRRPLVAAARWTGTAVRWGVHRSLPGMTGAACVSVAAGAIAGHIWHRGLWPWVSLAVAGAFALWIGREMNQPPRQQPDDS
jgi:hypothetical protein